jgi:hypothetical protein
MPKKPRGKRRPAKTSHGRTSMPHGGLHKELHPKSRWEYLDMDYLNQLSDEEKSMLSKFIDEYYGAALAPADDPESWEADFHSTDALRKECRDRNNARNRDIYSILRTRGMVEDIKIDNSETEFHQNELSSAQQNLDHGHQEDIVIELIETGPTGMKEAARQRLILEEKLAKAEKAQARARQELDRQEPQE